MYVLWLGREGRNGREGKSEEGWRVRAAEGNDGREMTGGSARRYERNPTVLVD